VNQAAEGEDVGLEWLTARCPSPVGKEWGCRDEQLSFRAEDEMNNCHFEPKARNLKFQSPPVL